MWETGVSRGVKGSAARGAGRTGHTVAGGAPAIAAAPGHHPLRERTALPDPAQPCDLVTVPARQGLEAVDILRLRDGIGPVLHDGACHTLGFLVPPGTADGWDVPGSACTQTHGRGLALSAAHGEEVRHRTPGDRHRLAGPPGRRVRRGHRPCRAARGTGRGGPHDRGRRPLPMSR